MNAHRRIAIAGLAALLAAGCALALAPLGELGRAGPRVSYLPVPAPGVSGISYDGRWLWITVDDGAGGTLYKAEPRTGAVRRRTPLRIGAMGGSAWDGRLLWQLAYEAKKIHAIDLATGRVVKVIPSPGKGMCSGMTFDGRHLWLANYEDEKLYRIDSAGRVLETLNGDFETTGLAWDGRSLWNGILVGTVSHGEAMPFTGFVQQRDPAGRPAVAALQVPGIGPGTSSWTPGAARSRTFWWADGYHNRIVRFDLPARGTALVRAGIALLALCALALAALAWRGTSTVPAADARVGLGKQQAHAETQRR